MNQQNIVVATDFSATAHVVLDAARSLARSMNARLLIVHVYTGEEVYEFGSTLYTPNEAFVRKQLLSALPAATDIACDYKLLKGIAVREIVGFAEEVDAKLIVLGTHGRTGMARLLTGSVAEGVLRSAQCPVLTVKPSHVAGDVRSPSRSIESAAG